MSSSEVVNDKKLPVRAFRGAPRFQPLFRKTLKPFVKMIWRVELQGLENIPKSGSAILCPNHLSFFEITLLMALSERNISFIGKIEYMNSWKTRWLSKFGMIPVNRSGGSYADDTFEACKKVLERGELLGIFPEGTRTPDGRLYRGHTGAARLATWLGCPIVPVGVFGTDVIQPHDSTFPKLGGKAKLVFCEPIKVISTTQNSNTELKDDPIYWRQITNKLMKQLAVTTGQEYCDEYSTKSREEYRAIFQNNRIKS